MLITHFDLKPLKLINTLIIREFKHILFQWIQENRLEYQPDIESLTTMLYTFF